MWQLKTHERYCERMCCCCWCCYSYCYCYYPTLLNSTLLWHICSAESRIAKYTEQYKISNDKYNERDKIHNIQCNSQCNLQPATENMEENDKTAAEASHLHSVMIMAKCVRNEWAISFSVSINLHVFSFIL